MDLFATIDHLKSTVPLFEGRVAGMAQFDRAMSGTVLTTTFPAAYLLPLGSDATENDESQALYQIVTSRVGLVVEFDNTDDRRGQSVTLLYAETQRQIFASLLNWRDTDPEHAERGFEFASSDILQSDRARIFYRWDFILKTLITDFDGWQVVGPPLLEIDANSNPGDPKPPFKVILPQ